MAVKVNVTLVCALSLPLLVFGNRVLTVWLGSGVGKQPLMFPIIACGVALLGMNVTGHYALLAMGHVRVATYLNLLAGIAMLLIMALLVPKQGLQGAALARLVYGPITCLAYLYLHRIIGHAEPRAFLSRSSI
jgi:O-antigen/teichoic acid export membrane protein